MTSTLRITAAALVATAAALTGLWTAAERPDRLIERAFADAFDRLEAPHAARAERPLFDPAHLHLSRLPAAPARVAPIAIGDRMTIAGRAGGSTTYEVVAMQPLPPVPGTDSPTAALALVMVTAVAVGEVPAETMRFVVETGPATQAVPALTRPHAL
jgi:hypothetical protein